MFCIYMIYLFICLYILYIVLKIVFLPWCPDAYERSLVNTCELSIKCIKSEEYVCKRTRIIEI